MTASRNDIKRWIESGIEQGATHVVIACDTFDHDNYPVYVMPGGDVAKEVSDRSGKNMQTVDEVYNLTMCIEEQMAAAKAWNL